MQPITKKARGGQAPACSSCPKQRPSEPLLSDIFVRPPRAPQPSYPGTQVSWSEADGDALKECYCEAAANHAKEGRASRAAESYSLAASLEGLESLSSALNRAHLLYRAFTLYLEAGEYGCLQETLEGCARAYERAAQIVGSDGALKATFLKSAARIRILLYDFEAAGALYMGASECETDRAESALMARVSRSLSGLTQGDGMALENLKISMSATADNLAHEGKSEDAAALYLAVAELEGDLGHKNRLMARAAECGKEEARS